MNRKDPMMLVLALLLGAGINLALPGVSGRSAEALGGFSWTWAHSVARSDSLGKGTWPVRLW